MHTSRHKFKCSALLLLGIYILHLFLLDNFVTASFITSPLHGSAVHAGPMHHPHHHHRDSDVAVIRMLEKHEGAKQLPALPVVSFPKFLSRIVLIATDAPQIVDCLHSIESLSPSSYRVYLQDSVFRI